jgi:hypothetical protein
MSNAIMAARWALVVGAAVVLLLAGRAAAVEPPDPGVAVKDAYAELSALLYAPPSGARDIEIAAIVTRNTDFDELTRRAFGEPCPKPGCVDHWALFSSVQQGEVRALYEAAVTVEWTHELARAFAYDVDIKSPAFHDRDARVRVLARQKGSTDPSVGLDLFTTKTAPYKLVDLEAARTRFTRIEYKQFHKTLADADGYAALVARLKRRAERGASVDAGSSWPEAEDAEAPEEDAGPVVDAAPAESPPAPTDAPRSPPPSELPWGAIVFGGLLALGVGIGLGRMRRKNG